MHTDTTEANTLTHVLARSKRDATGVSGIESRIDDTERFTVRNRGRIRCLFVVRQCVRYLTIYVTIIFSSLFISFSARYDWLLLTIYLLVEISPLDLSYFAYCTFHYLSCDFR